MPTSRRYLPFVTAATALLFAGCEVNDPNDDLTDPSIQPVVVSTFPPPNSAGPYDGFYVRVQYDFWFHDRLEFRIRFNKLMDLSSIRQATSFSSSRGSVRLDTAWITTCCDFEFNFHVEDNYPAAQSEVLPLQVGEVCTLTVGASALDVNGNELGQAYVLVATPEPRFRVTGMQPVTGSASVPDYTRFVVEFNSRVDSTIVQKLQISPPTSGRWGIDVGDMNVYYYHAVGMMGSTAYTVAVQPDAVDMYGNGIDRGYETTFTTRSYMLEGTSPRPGSAGVPPRSEIVIQVTEPVDLASASEAITITPDVERDVLLDPNNARRVLVRPRKGMMPKSRYVVSVDTTLRSHYGAPLPEGVEFSFTTDSFRVVSVQPANGQTNTSLQPLITVRYNAFVDIWTTPSGFRLTDLLGTRLTGGWRYPNPWTLTFEPHYPLAPNSVHTITVSDQILDLYGNPLDVPLVTTFTTGNPGRQEP